MGQPIMMTAKTRRGAVALLLAQSLLWTPTLGAAQQPERVIRSDVNLVLVEATVKDRAGRVLKDLKQEDFRLWEDATEQRIIHFSRDQMPLAVALLVDLSGSIQPFLKQLRHATATALRSLKREDRVALFTFSSEVELFADLTTDKAGIAEELELLRASGGTNINDALFLAAEYLRKEAPAARRVIILVSDNVATDPGMATPEEVLTEALEADAALYSVKVPGRNPPMARMMLEAMAHRLVKVSKIAAETGGEVIEVEQEGSLYLALQTVIERLKTRYTLGYYPLHAQPDGRFRRLEVRLHPSWGARGRDYALISKRGYYARPQQTASR